MTTLRTVFALILVSISAFGQIPDLKPGFNLFSKEQDVQLGREAAAQIERQVPVVRDSDLQSYVQRIGQRLASHPKAGGFPYSFKVVNDPSVNAFALPGGPTYVHTGLIKAADNEAQLAGVIAHEISHVALRHGTNQASKSNLIQLPAMILGSVVGGGGSMLGQLAQLGIGLGANSVLLKFSRDAETQADILGAQLMANAGYNPLEMARFFEKLQAGGGHGPQFLSDHPNPGNRMKRIQDTIRYLPQRQYTADSGQFRQVQSRLGSLPSAPQQGTRARLGNDPNGSQGGIQSSGRMREFRGQAFSLAYPENWEVFNGSGDGAAVTIAPRNALAQDRSGNVQIGYGAMVSYFFGRDNRIDLQQDTRDLIRELQRQNPSMEVGGQRRVNVNGQQGLVTTIYSQSPYQGETEHDYLLTVPRPEGLFYMVFITPARASRDLQPTFDAMLRSVRFSR